MARFLQLNSTQLNSTQLNNNTLFTKINSSLPVRLRTQTGRSPFENLSSNAFIGEGACLCCATARRQGFRGICLFRNRTFYKRPFLEYFWGRRFLLKMDAGS